MPDAGELIALAERCEAATGADRELDAAIYDLTPHALDYQRISIRLADRSRFDRYHDGWVTVYAAKGEADPYPEDLPRYTASLDSAGTLVPKGFMRRLQEWPDGVCCAALEKNAGDFGAIDARHTESFAASLPLALIASSFRAHASQSGDA